jgi:proteasome lid subunit RPN8/RPN11
MEKGIAMLSSTEPPKTSIQLLPAEEVLPRSTRIPFSQAINWRPAHNDDSVPEPVVSVFMTRPAFSECCNHAMSDMDNEVGGWLLGKWRTDKETNKQFIIVDTILPAQNTVSRSTYLTFTQQSQVDLRNHLDEKYPDKELVGWFHTHPRMGVFLSSYDTWLHQHFFPEMWQVALVIEPHSGVGGFFVRQNDGELDPRQYYGFYELVENIEQSVVDWHNLTISP